MAINNTALVKVDFFKNSFIVDMLSITVSAMAVLVLGHEIWPLEDCNNSTYPFDASGSQVCSNPLTLCRASVHHVVRHPSCTSHSRGKLGQADARSGK